ncbi:MAG: class I SAM-dependent methyltransferase [Acidimicrobiales bacterium]
MTDVASERSAPPGTGRIDEPETVVTPRRSRAAYYEWEFSGPTPNHRYLIPALRTCLTLAGGARLLDLGSGNGYVTAQLRDAGMAVTGVEGTPSGVERASRSWPDIPFVQHDITTPLPASLCGRFDVVTSVEVIEHLFLPREVFARAREALGEQGTLIVSTPFHGYWKNLALALAGKWDAHHQPLSDFGHVKFFSEDLLGAMAEECGFRPRRFLRAGRAQPLAATMLMVADLGRTAG